MVRNSHRGKPGARKPSDNGPEFRIHDVRRAYKRPRHYEEWAGEAEDEEVEELEDFDALDDIEEGDLEVPEEFIGTEDEERG